MTTEKFLKRVETVHGDLYDYSKVINPVWQTNISIVCEEHGEFQQRIDHHLNGSGCARCRGLHKRTTEEVIKEFQEVHDNLYDYSKVDYISNHKKIIITCNEHGEFRQTPHNHKQGQGCRLCYNERMKNQSLLERYDATDDGSKPGIFYKIKFKHKELEFEFLKVGVTSRSIKERFQRKMYKDYEYEIIEQHNVTNLKSVKMEQEFLETTDLKRFKFPYNCKFIGYSECFILD